MRISETEKKIICNAITQQDSNAQIFLFGSRTDDTKKGGDIDILIQSEKIDLMEIIKIKANIFTTLPEQKIDLIIQRQNEQNTFIDYITNQLVPLNE